MLIHTRLRTLHLPFALFPLLIHISKEKSQTIQMETVEEQVDEYSWREVLLPHLIPVVQSPELEREPAGERRRGRDILIAIDHGHNSRHAFDWVLAHLCRLADTIHLVHAVSNVQNEVVYEKSRELMEKLAVEALQTVLVGEGTNNNPKGAKVQMKREDTWPPTTHRAEVPSWEEDEPIGGGECCKGRTNHREGGTANQCSARAATTQQESPPTPGEGSGRSE
ncbi:hypothetical protein M5K25_003300 [Dendrobium thyrsiflorum]|uniref:UspA domain-containing protein n=1 Tax=Dendrobium thyrsiflorum TaxID=117978 RepID=A0ABD0VK90_DENTH